MTGTSVGVVVVGAGLAGLTAAHELRDRDLVVLEARDRLGGRTLSGTHGRYWYNSGAQFVWDHRTVDLCRALGLRLLDAHGARASLFVRDRLVHAANPYVLFTKLPLSIGERLDLARTISRLRRLAARTDRADAARLDARSLAELMGDCGPLTRTIMDMVSESGTGLSTAEVSGWIGLGYAIHLFGGDVNSTLKQVEGGTQALAKALGTAVGLDRIVLGAEVASIERCNGRVTVRYHVGEQDASIEAETCVVAAPADAVLRIVPDLPDAKQTALARMTPYGRIVSVAWLTNEHAPVPWDRLLVTPVVGDTSFEQISNNAFFRQQAEGRRTPGGALVTLSTGARAARLWDHDDEAIRGIQLAELSRIFPSARPALSDAVTRIARWHGFPAFRRGWLSDQPALRSPLGAIHFCGDYTSQPGTPGAVGSGYHVAQAVRQALLTRKPSAV